MEQHKYSREMTYPGTHRRVRIWRSLDSPSHLSNLHSSVIYPEAHQGRLSMMALLGTSESSFSSQAPGSDSCPLLAASHILTYTYTSCLSPCHQLADSPSQRGPSPLSAHWHTGPGTAMVRTHADHTHLRQAIPRVLPTSSPVPLCPSS